MQRYTPAGQVEVVGITNPGQAPGMGQHSANGTEKISIPPDFIRLGCLACNCNYLTWPQCFGFKGSGTFLCYEGQFAGLKCLDSSDDCFLCIGGDTEIVVPRTCCKGYTQYFCFECFVSVPMSDDNFRSAPVGILPILAPTFMDNVVICGAFCCYIDSLNCGCPACCFDGCYVKDVRCCFAREFIALRWMCWDQTKPNPDTLCILSKGQQYLQWPKTCCKGISRCLCFDTRFAIPCDDEVPCVYTYFPCCVCCVNGQCMCGCCMTLADAKVKANVGGPQRVQPVQMMQPGVPVQGVPTVQGVVVSKHY